MRTPPSPRDRLPGTSDPAGFEADFPDLPLLARRFHALSDEKRLGILELLTVGERCVCELIPETGMAQSLLSFHLKTLREAGLVTDRKEGRWVHYSLVPGVLDEMARWARSRS